MNVTMHCVAVSLSGLSACSSSIALMPSGVAALLRPSMLAASATHDRAGRRMLRRHFGKQPAQQRPQRPPDDGNQAGGFGDAHHAEPERHDADQADRDLHGGRRRLHGAFRHRLGGAVDRRDDERDRHQAEPDVVEHAADGSVASRASARWSMHARRT